jgi:Plasmid pRiA4b ORF-3-like protein
MIYKFRLLSNEVKDFIRDVEISSDQTFYDFHKALTKDFQYDDSQIASFYITNQNWEKIHEVTLFDMSNGENSEILIMDKILLEALIEEPKQRMLYVFDFFNERTLFIELIEKNKKIKDTEYPRFTFEQGHPPDQILLDDFIIEDSLSDD